MTSWGKVLTLLAGFSASLLIHTVAAHDFGGSSAGDPPPGPPEPPPCERSSDPCCGSGSGAVGDPIRTFDGGFYLSDTDLQVGASYPIRLVRRYDSRSEFDNALGFGWAFDHDRRLFEYPDGSVLLRSGCGRRDTFVFTGGAYVTPRDASQGTLKEHGDGSYSFTYANGKRDEFDTDGRLVAIVNHKGQSHRLSYDERGRLPLLGTSPNSVDPNKPMVVAYQPRLTRIEEQGADGVLTGAVVEFFYNEQSGRLTHVIASDGRRIDYRHDEWQTATRGNLVQVEGLDNYQHSFKYEDPADAHRITGLQRGAGAVWVTNTYDNEGRVIKQVEGQNILELDYVEIGTTQVTETVRSASGEVLDTRDSTFVFDEAGYLLKRIDPLGHEYRQIYNDTKDRIRIEYWEKRGNDLILLSATDYTYNGQAQKTGAITTLASGELITQRWTYDNGWLAGKEQFSSKDPDKVFRTEYTFVRDAQSQPINIASIKQTKDDSSFAITTLTYCNGETGCPDSALVKQIDGPRTDVQDIMSFTYYDNTDQSGCNDGGNCYRKGDIKKITDALGYTREFLSYNVTGQATQTRDANGLTVNYRYHPRGWLLEETILGSDDNSSNDDIVTRYDYDDRGNAIRVTESDGSSLVMSYDQRDRLFQIEDAEGNKIKYTLDSQGNTLAEEVYDGEGNLKRNQSWIFDKLNRVKQRLGAEQQVTDYSYDGMGHLTLSADALSIKTHHSYDGLGRLVGSIEDAEGLAASSRFAYDATGSIIEVIDPRDNSTLYEYDLAGNLTKLVSPDTSTSTRTYDTAGNLTSSTDARGIVSNFTYDALNRLISINYPGSTSENATFTYDSTDGGNKGAGRLTGYSNDAGTTALTYDALGRITQQEDKIAGLDFTIGYRYDSEGRVTSITYPSGRIVSYSYDALGRIAKVTTQQSAEADPQTILSNIQYDSMMGIGSMEYGNGITQSYRYDQDGRLQAINASGVGDIQSQTYTYDSVSNITLIADNLDSSKNQSFTYDDLYRLADGSYAEGQSNLAYDLIGNRTQQAFIESGESPEVTTYGYESNSNRLTEVGGQAWVIDDAGNTVSSGGGVYEYTYNHANRLRTYSEDGTVQGTYYYNALGQRVLTDKTEDNLLHYDQNGQYLSKTKLGEAGAVQSQVDYIYLGNMPVAQVEVLLSAGQIQSTTLTYLHSDHLNTPRIGTNENAIVWRWDSDAFGHTEPNVDPDGDFNLVEVSLRFPGQIKGEEAPYYYNYFRDYDPSSGRYLQSDPIGLEGELNTYAYVSGNPINYFDPFGLKEYPDNFVGPLPPDGYYTSEMTQTKCGKVPSAPPGTNINSNMQLADDKWDPFWFYDQVRNKGPWDYKQKGRKYEDFGNFNFGATGSAFGFPQSVLQRGAGWANQKADPTRKNLGSPWGWYPYGDDPSDQEQIEKGSNYCECMGY
ncbi:RHS repeat-associated core domain-containing protein [Microbulbifer epialgicus]|uniref:RHS repeat-associated core domain-containing protein n=1 Tax=Microbulbifer epialgicus TaxID=393907 RepID=A0ABV4P7R4_9GAMM